MVTRYEPSHLFTVLPDEFSISEEYLATCDERQVAPGWKSPAGGIHSHFNLRSTALRHSRDDRTSRWVVHRAGLFGRISMAAPSDSSGL